MEKPVKLPWLGAMQAFNQNKLLRAAKGSVQAKNLEANMVLTNFLIAGTASGARLELSASLMAGYGADGITKQFWLGAADGKAYFATGNAFLDNNGANYLATASGSGEYIRFISNVASLSKLITEKYVNLSADADVEAWKVLYSDNALAQSTTARIGLQMVADSGLNIANAKLFLEGSYAGGANFLKYTTGTGSLMMIVDGDTGNLTLYNKQGRISQEAWTAVSFEAGWVNYDATTYATAAYFKDSHGVVHLKGLVKNGSIGGNLFTLPALYRPALTEHFPMVSNGLFGYGWVQPNGVVSLQSGSNTWVALNGISFRVA